MRNYIKYPTAKMAAVSPWWFPINLYEAYRFPRNLPGGGIIGIGELGGGWIEPDIAEFFTRNHLPIPTINDIPVNGGSNNHDTGDDASAEVNLDIQIAASVYEYCTTYGNGPNADKPADIRVYWAPNSGDSIPAATRQAAKDGCDVMSWSWGEDEALTGKSACEQMNMAAGEATSAGMVTLAAAGDNDSSDGGPTPANVDNPASCPYVVACGGTRKPHRGPETVWNNNPGSTDGSGTGGGVSTVFALPAYQSVFAGKYSGRVVPDIAANADPETAWVIVLGGQLFPVGGTSAVAPLMAGLLAACGKKLGFINPKIWANPGDFISNIAGNNGKYSQPPVPGPCSGMGRPMGRFTGIFTGAQ